MNSHRKKSELPLKIGDRYLVLRSDNTWHPAEILKVKSHRGNPDKTEYYVHYEGCNCRLDEWVSRSRFDTTSCVKSHKNISSTVAYGADQSERRVTRSQSGKHDKINSAQKTCDEKDATTNIIEEEHKAKTEVKYIEQIIFGQWEISTWYFSPYPDEFLKLRTLYICEYCLKYMKFAHTYVEHRNKCKGTKPPGKVIYLKGRLCVYEVDGERQKLFCQLLCLLAKLFLEDKDVFYIVSSFLFYVLTETDNTGEHIVGYFSKEKKSREGYNLACIMVLPPFQKLGFGQFLISFSYELSKIEGIVGSPEKPLSDLGQRSYRSYWSWVILNILTMYEGKSFSFEQVCRITSMTVCDIFSTLESLNMVENYMGQHAICIHATTIDEQLRRCKRPKLMVDSSCIQYSPPKE